MNVFCDTTVLVAAAIEGHVHQFRAKAAPDLESLITAPPATAVS